MSELINTQRDIQQERALIISVILPKREIDIHDPLGELRSLARTAGAKVVDEMIAKRTRVHPGLYVGTGKAQEIADRVVQNDVTTVIFDNDLSPGQIRDLEKVIGCKVLDRSEVILDIFAANARTNEARLQVELAQLEYTYPRLRNMWTHLERMAGGASSAAAAVGGIGTRGPGEKQLEIDRRLVQRRVSQLKERILEVDGRKQRMVSSRQDEFRVCLVGYTNAGKSTVMNLFTDAGVFVADKLFATLDTRTRRWKLGDGQSVLLSDTVGFISDLPHHLVASFRATLEEAIGADLLLHVADASHERVLHQMEAVNEVLDEMGIAEKSRLLLLNKIDRIQDPSVRVVLAGKYPDAIFLSAATGENADKVVAALSQRMSGQHVTVELNADVTNGRLMQFLARYAQMSNQAYEGRSVKMTATLKQRYLDELRQFHPAVEIL